MPNLNALTETMNDATLQRYLRAVWPGLAWTADSSGNHAFGYMAETTGLTPDARTLIEGVLVELGVETVSGSHLDDEGVKRHLIIARRPVSL